MKTAKAQRRDGVCYSVGASLNFTGRVDIDPSDIQFELTPRGEGEYDYTVKIKNWARIRSRLKPDTLVSVVFRRRAGASQCRQDKGEVRTIGLGLYGTIPAIGPAETMGMRLLFIDPETRMIVAGSSKPGPDSVKEPGEGRGDRPGAVPGKVVPERRVETPGGASALLVTEDPDTAGYWDLDLDDDMPVLKVHPSLGRARVEGDPLVQAAVFPEVFRRVVHALAVHDRHYGDAPWAAAWKKLAAQHAPTGSWDHYTADTAMGEELPPGLAEERIRQALPSFVASLGLVIPRDDNSEL